MKMLDGNTAALSLHEAEQGARHKSYDSHIKEAESLLKEWVRDGETIGKPKQFSKLDSFILADMITDEPWQYGLDNEFVANLITSRFASDCDGYIIERTKHIGDSAYEAWLTTPEASNALDDIVEYLEEYEREEYENA